MENDIARKPILGLLTSAGDAANAVETHGNTVGILQHTGLKIRADIAALLAAINAVDGIKTALTPMRSNLRQLLQDSRSLLIVGRDNLKPILGYEVNERWEPTGLTDALSIPRTAEDVQPLLRCFQNYFVANPSHEVDPRDVTASKYGELFAALDTARMGVREQEVALEQARRLRDQKVLQLRKRLRGLIDELDALLDPLDPRWKWFGFNMPGAQATPEVPENVVVTLTGSNAAMKWKAAPRADYYHVWKKVIGVDEELVLVGSPADLDFTFEELPANATIELAVSAVNNGGESQPSEAVKIVTN